MMKNENMLRLISNLEDALFIHENSPQVHRDRVLLGIIRAAQMANKDFIRIFGITAEKAIGIEGVAETLSGVRPPKKNLPK